MISVLKIRLYWITLEY